MSLELLLLASAAFVAPPSSLRPASRCAGAPMRVFMASDDEAAARKRWLERTQGDAPPPPPRMSDSEVERLRQEARERSRALMGDSEQMASGAGVQFGFGVADDEDYGYGPPKPRRPAAPLEESGAPSGLTRELSGDAPRGSGFDGRDAEWTRKPELVSPNPPPMSGTLRAPAPGALPAQSFAMDFEGARADIEAADAAEVRQQEQDLLDALRGDGPSDEEIAERERKLREDSQNRPWNAPE
jgi:hypothetical protein